MQRDKALATLNLEITELENVFTLLVLGQFIGFPAPPSSVSLELLPLMDKHLHIMLNRSGYASDPLAMLVSQLNMDI